MADDLVVPLPVGLSTSIGSLPHYDPSEAQALDPHRLRPGAVEPVQP